MLQDLPELVCKTLVEEHLSDLEIKTLRQVSKEWNHFVDSTLVALKPRGILSSHVSSLIPANT